MTGTIMLKAKIKGHPRKVILVTRTRNYHR